MAVTIISQPQSPNYSKNELVYNLSSDNINEAQFSFVVDTYIAGVSVDRRRKQPNPVGNVVVDLQKIFDANLDPDLGVLGSTSAVNGAESSKVFSVRFGEEYLVGTNLNTFTDLATSSDISIVRGYQEYNTLALGTRSLSNTSNTVLSNTEERISIHRDDTLSISRYDNSSNTVIHTPITIPNSGSTFNQVIEGVTYTVDVYDVRNRLGEERFAWENRAGGWDYFTFDQVGTMTLNADKELYEQSNIRFGRSTTSNRDDLNSNVYRGGSQNYSTTYSNIYTKNSRWVIPSVAEWLSGIYDSPNVFRDMGDGTWARVILLNASYEIPQATRVTTNFNYELMYRFALDKRGF